MDLKLLVLLVLLILFLVFAPQLVHAQETYTTLFPSPSEDPISEGGKWQVPGTTASQFGNVQKTPGFAFGVSQPTSFGDPTAILTGTWGPNQNASATAVVTSAPSGCCQEVELRFRMTITSGSITGYEMFCPTQASPTYGPAIVRWNGPNGQYVTLAGSPIRQCVNGDVLSGNISGTNPVTLNFFINGTLVATACDNGQASGGSCGGFTYNGPGGAAGPFTSGSPGMGFYMGSGHPFNTFGFSQFKASDSGTPPNPPTNFRVTSSSF